MVVELVGGLGFGAPRIPGKFLVLVGGLGVVGCLSQVLASVVAPLQMVVLVFCRDMEVEQMVLLQ